MGGGSPQVRSLRPGLGPFDPGFLFRNAIRKLAIFGNYIWNCMYPNIHILKLMLGALRRYGVFEPLDMAHPCAPWTVQKGLMRHSHRGHQPKSVLQPENISRRTGWLRPYLAQKGPNTSLGCHGCIHGPWVNLVVMAVFMAPLTSNLTSNSSYTLGSRYRVLARVLLGRRSLLPCEGQPLPAHWQNHGTQHACTVLYYTIRYYTILYDTILYYTLYNTMLCYAMLCYTILYYTILSYCSGEVSSDIMMAGKLPKYSSAPVLSFMRSIARLTSYDKKYVSLCII